MNWAEVITPVVLTLLTAILGWIGAYLKKKFDIDLEKQDREALHSALKTGVQAALSKDKSIKEATAETVEKVKPIIVKEAVEYAQVSVPDALKRLSPVGGVLADIALSKLEELIQGKTTLVKAVNN